MAKHTSNPQLDAVHRISSALFAKVDLDEMLRETLAVSMETADADAGSILLFDADRDALVFRYVVGPVADRLTGAAVDLDSTGQAATVYKSGETLISSKGFDQRFDEASGYHTTGTLTAAIRNFGGQPIGVIQLVNKRAGQFDARDSELIEIVCALAATVIANAQRADTEKQAALARALAYMGHQLKNQAGIVRGAERFFGAALAEQVNALKDQSVQEADQIAADLDEMRSMVREGAEKAHRLAGVINEYGHRRDLFEFRPNNLKAALETELGQLVRLAEKYGDRVDLSGVMPGPPFPFDPFFIGQSVFNLVDNALQAIRQSGKKGTVRVSAETGPPGKFPDGDYVDISVSDDGPGIPPQALASILRGEAKTTKSDGSGVGTRLVRDVAQTHSGLFLGESTPGQGATFTIRLPLRQV